MFDFWLAILALPRETLDANATAVLISLVFEASEHFQTCSTPPCIWALLDLIFMFAKANGTGADPIEPATVDKSRTILHEDRRRWA